MGGLDDHHAAVVAGDSKALAINNVVGNAGLTVGRIQAWQYWKPGEVVFIKAIGRALTTYGDEIVGRVLSMIGRSEEHTSELQSLMRISYAVFCLKKKKNTDMNKTTIHKIKTRSHIKYT